MMESVKVRRAPAVVLCLCTALACAAGAGSLEEAKCAELGNPDQAMFEEMMTVLAAQSGNVSAGLRNRLAACGLDAEKLGQRFCRQAYLAQDTEVLLKHCRDESWALARAQCERSFDSISPRFAEFCKAFGGP